MASGLSVRHRAYFRSELMNRLAQQYESTLLKSLVQYPDFSGSSLGQPQMRQSHPGYVKVLDIP